jgi:hypothetical protein
MAEWSHTQPTIAVIECPLRIEVGVSFTGTNLSDALQRSWRGDE